MPAREVRQQRIAKEPFTFENSASLEKYNSVLLVGRRRIKFVFFGIFSEIPFSEIRRFKWVLAKNSEKPNIDYSEFRRAA